MPLALGIETSCDDCSVAVVNEAGEVLFLAQGSQSLVHKNFGGIVPELAGRRHTVQLLPLIDEALKAVPIKKIDLIAVTNRPGLLSSLLVGSVTAKSLSLAFNKPLIGLNHIEAHIFSSLIFKKGERGNKKSFCFPVLAFVVSGGHSQLFYVKDFGESKLLASTRDDSAGEAFDKFARLLGFAWPGGPKVDALALKAKGQEEFFSQINTEDLSFSFSGIKSQAQRLLSQQSKPWIENNKAELCADYQRVIVQHLMSKLKTAFEKNPCQHILVGGGVSANSYFRTCLKEWAKKQSLCCFFPEKTFCTDNGAMVAWLGLNYFLKGKKDGLNMPCSPKPLEKDFFNSL